MQHPGEGWKQRRCAATLQSLRFHVCSFKFHSSFKVLFTEWRCGWEALFRISVIEITGWVPQHTQLLCSLYWITEQGEGGRKCILSSPDFVFLATVAFSTPPHVWKRGLCFGRKHRPVLHIVLLSYTNYSRCLWGLFAV